MRRKQADDGQTTKRPLRPLTPYEQSDLESISRARSAPVEAVIRTKILLAVAGGMTHTQAAHSVDRKSNDAVSALVQRFNEEGLDALIPQHVGGFPTETVKRKNPAFRASLNAIQTWKRMEPPPGR